MHFPNFFIISFVLYYFLDHHSQAALHPRFDNTTDQCALLSFKYSIRDPNGALDSWHPNTSFCMWRGVLCNPIKQRVIGLQLGNHSLAGTIAPHIANLSFLRLLNLQNNSFFGEIPVEIHRLSRLQVLNLSVNNLHGTIPPSLSRCSMLRAIDLFDNRLHGKIPFELGSLSKLRDLNFARNNLSGLIPSSFGNLSSLNRFILKANNIEGPVPPEFGRLHRLSHLQLGENKISGSFPTQLLNISSLNFLVLALNEISGNFPSNLFTALSNLSTAYFGGNMFHGQIPESLSNASNLELLDLSSNQLSGRIPSLWKLEKIQILNVELNFLTSEGQEGLNFVTSLTNSTRLRVLSVATNLLTGQLPLSIGNLSSQLLWLIIGENQFDGNIPQEIGNLDGLIFVSLFANSFTGKIPSSLGNLKNLQLLFLDSNFLSGSIPETLGNLGQLSEIDLSENNLTGKIPPSFSNYERLLLFDLSSNRLSGNLPKEIFSLSTLSEFNISSNDFSGSLPPEVGKLTMVQILDVSKNQLSGPIPSTIEDCLTLEVLEMSRNSFQGPIPSSLAKLKGIKFIDLSSNKFAGKIPPLDGLEYLQYLNLSSNELQGEVPRSGIFLNISLIFLSNNSELCGGIVELGLPKCTAYSTGKRTNVKLIAGLVAGAILLCIAVALSFVFIRRKQLAPVVTDVTLFEGPYRLYSYNELKYATGNFSAENLIGRGSFGSVYKGVMRDGTLIAIKVLDLDHRGAMKSFLTECQVFKNIRHRNLVKILSACSNFDFKALVLQFMPNGNLETWLHKRRDGISECRLNLTQRIDIAIDVASAIEYLHHECETPVVHCDLKPSNVLLDENMTAYVGDFGLARMLQAQGNSTNHNQSSTSGLKGSVGYIAPEYGFGVGVTTKGDVYSYGIFLLEMLTGRSPTEDMFCGEINLHRWVEAAIPNMVMDILDEKVKEYPFQTQMVGHLISILDIGLKCASESPDERPEMKYVSTTIKKIRSLLFKEGPSTQYYYPNR